MKHEESFGVIPLKYEDGEWKTLLVQHHQGHWTYPKGKKEDEESPLESAKRELAEETGLCMVECLSSEPYFENYRFQKKGECIDKRVLYYLATVSGELQLQESEIQNARWVTLQEAISLHTYAPSQEIASQVYKKFYS